MAVGGVVWEVAAVEILGEGLADLRATRTSIKWRYYAPDVVPVWVAEMDARPCPVVTEAVTAALTRGDTGYAVLAPFVAAVADFAGRRWGWEIDPRSAFQVPDVMIGIEEILQAATRPGSPVVLSAPCYDSFYGFVESIGRRVSIAHLDPAQRLDHAALDRAFAQAGAGAAYLLCNPQNPTGTVHTHDELAELATIADRHEILVISDEIHAPLVYPGVDFVPYLSVPEAARGVALVSGSKAWNLAGLKAAIAFAGPQARSVLGRLHEVVTHGAHHLGVIAQTAAYAEGEPWLDQLLGELVERRALLARLLAERLPQVVPVPAEATFLAWLDCSQLGEAEPAQVFLDRGDVALGWGSRYDPTSSGWARFNFATSAAVIEEAVDRMVRASVSSVADPLVEGQ